MKRFTHASLRVLSLALFVLSAGAVARAQDPVVVDPQNYTVLSDDPTARVLEYKDTPGTKGPKHSHPNYYVFVLSDAVRQFTDARPGDTTTCTGPSKTLTLKAGQVIVKTPVTHCEANVGTTDTHLYVVELKQPPKTTAKVPRGKRRR